MSAAELDPIFEENVYAVKEIAKDAGNIDKVEEILSGKDKILTDNKVVAVAGGSNTGKSSLINLILDRPIFFVSVTANLDKKMTIGATLNAERVKCDDKEIITIDELISKKKQYFGDYNKFDFEIKDEWLEKSKIKFIEVAGTEFISSTFCEADVVIYIISALMPLTKTDMESITLCALNNIPCKILLSKLDLIETKEEQDEVLSYVNDQLNKLFENMEATAINFASISTQKPLKEWIENVDIESSRQERLNLLLVEATNEIHSYAEIMIKDAEKKHKEDKNMIKTKQDEFMLQRVIWSKLTQDMVERRLNLRDKIEKNLRENVDKISDILIRDMENAPDFKIWWEKSMPMLIEDKMLNLSQGMKMEINAKVEEDQRRLVSEVNKEFSLKIDIVENNAELSQDLRLRNNNINLKQPNRWMMVSRVGVVIAIASAVTFSTVGIAVGTVFGLTGYEIEKIQILQNKEIIRKEILKYLNEFCIRYADEMDKQLKQLYENIIKELEEYNIKWQNEQIDMLQGGNTVNIEQIPEYYEKIIKRCDDVLTKLF